MAKMFFIPVSIIAGVLAGIVSKKVFDKIWGLVDQDDPPDSKQADIEWKRLLLAGAIQGAIARMVKESIDHGSRRAFYKTTGSWPGQEKSAEE
jgi:hypothetical protein